MLIKDTCFNSSKHIEDKTVNLFFCDPPYNILSGQEWDSQWKKTQFNRARKCETKTRRLQ